MKLEILVEAPISAGSEPCLSCASTQPHDICFLYPDDCRVTNVVVRNTFRLGVRCRVVTCQALSQEFSAPKAARRFTGHGLLRRCIR